MKTADTEDTRMRDAKSRTRAHEIHLATNSICIINSFFARLSIVYSQK